MLKKKIWGLDKLKNKNKAGILIIGIKYIKFWLFVILIFAALDNIRIILNIDIKFKNCGNWSLPKINPIKNIASPGP